jgi:hypothetical protein
MNTLHSHYLQVLCLLLSQQSLCASMDKIRSYAFHGEHSNQFKHDLYFQRVDLNKDGKMHREEFQKIRESKMK